MLGGEKLFFQEFGKVFLLTEFATQLPNKIYSSRVKFLTKPIKRSHVTNFMRQSDLQNVEEIKKINGRILVAEGWEKKKVKLIGIR